MRKPPAAINWKKRAGADGKPLVYAKQWHAEFSTAQKSRAQRFLAVFRITPDGCTAVPLTCGAAGCVTVGGWTIAAELDAACPASLRVTDGDGNAVLYNTAESRIGGSTLIRSAGADERELTDEIPVSLR